jgi:integrase
LPSIRKRGTRFQVQIRRKGFVVTRCVATRRDAARWAATIERLIDNGEYRGDQTQPLSEIVARYGKLVGAHQRRAENPILMLRELLRQSWADRPVTALSAAMLARYRDARLQVVSSGTVRRELGLLRTILRWAMREQGVSVPSELLTLRIPSDVAPRNRRLMPGELDALVGAAARSRNRWLMPLVLLAIETAMRQGELLALRWSCVDLEARTAFLPVTKNGSDRRVPLTERAVQILSTLRREGELLFPLSSKGLQIAWRRLARRAGIEDLRFHDLRHEAISRLFEKGLNVPEVAVMSGHRDPRMLFRYTHPRPEDIARKLAAAP